MIGEFYWLFLWNFKKASTVSYDTAFFKAVFIGKDADFSPRHEQGFDKVESLGKVRGGGPGEERGKH